MRIHLYLGEGWAPFLASPDEPLAWHLPEADHLDLPASTRKLAVVVEERVRDIYPDATIDVRPHEAGKGRLVKVDLDGDAAEVADESLALTKEDLEGGGYFPGAIIAGEIEGLIDGIVRDRPHTWRVSR